MSELIVISKEDLSQLIAQHLNPLHKAIKEIQESKIPDEWLSRQEYADANGISVSMVDKLRRSGKVQHKKIGSRVFIRYIKE